jgi:hypothetical protein
MRIAPIVIVGVPRSGTTLLRVLLDSHSQIAALPETHWLLGACGAKISLRALVEELTEGEFGAVQNIADLEIDDVREAARAFLQRLFVPLLERRGKRMLVLKTPDDIPYLDFLRKFLPEARFIHITRDGRDVAASHLAKKGTFFHDLREFGRLGYKNALRRWIEWETRIRAELYRDEVKLIGVRYEELVSNPRHELERITAFLGVPFEPQMLDYAAAPHDYPAWEAGSSDVAARARISSSSVGAWRRAKPTIEMLSALRHHEADFRAMGYAPSGLSLNRRQKILVALFDRLIPALEALSVERRRWRREWRIRILKGLRIAAPVAVIVLAGYFLAPLWLLERLHLAGHVQQAIFCACTALAFEIAYWPAPFFHLDPETPTLPFALKTAGVTTACVGLLEIAQILTPNRHARVSDFVENAVIVVSATCLLPMLLRAISFLRRRGRGGLATSAAR